MWACHPAVCIPWPRIKSTSRRSRTRRQTRTSICARTALLPIAFCVGRWVATTSVTATARPRLAIESANSFASSPSSWTDSQLVRSHLPSSGLPRDRPRARRTLPRKARAQQDDPRHALLLLHRPRCVCQCSRGCRTGAGSPSYGLKGVLSTGPAVFGVGRRAAPVQ